MILVRIDTYPGNSEHLGRPLANIRIFRSVTKPSNDNDENASFCYEMSVDRGGTGLERPYENKGGIFVTGSIDGIDTLKPDASVRLVCEVFDSLKRMIDA